MFSVWFPRERLNEGFVCMWRAQLKLPLNSFFHRWLYTGRNIPQYSYAKGSLYSVREASQSLEKRIVLYLLEDQEEIVFWGVILNFVQWKAAFLERLRGRAGDELWIWMSMYLCGLTAEKWIYSVLFSLTLELCGLVVSVLVKHRLLFLFLSKCFC